MFKDFTSSGRGPGLVAMLIALVVLAGFSALAIAVYYDDGYGSTPSIEAKISELDTEITLVRNRLAEEQHKLETLRRHGELRQEIPLKNKELERSNADLTQHHLAYKKAEEDLESLVNDFLTYQKHYRINVRKSAEGEIIDLSETLGKDFEKVKIRSISATYMQVYLPSAPKKIPFEQLPPDIQDRFQFHSKEASDYIAKQMLQNKLQRERIQESQKEIEKKREVRRADARIAQIRKLTREIQKLNAEAETKRRVSLRYEDEADMYEEKDSIARISGRPSSHKISERTARDNSLKYQREEKKLRAKIEKLHQELDRLH